LNVPTNASARPLLSGLYAGVGYHLDGTLHMKSHGAKRCPRRGASGWTVCFAA